MDQKGYIISGLSFLLIIPTICLIALFADISYMGSQSYGLAIKSDVISSTQKDIENNIPIIAEKTIQETANGVIEDGNPLRNSRTAIRRNLQQKMNDFTSKYNVEGIDTNCQIRSLDSSNDPFKLQINSTISINKSNISHRENISQDISLIDPNYPIPDPLPFIKCKNFGGASKKNNRVFYGSCLTNYLKSKNKTNIGVYINATSPLIIKKCPYMPYETHGTSFNHINLKNCIDNGYYHESNDGACFLCRLEGNAVCSHYGIETMIIPRPFKNKTNNSAVCSMDHVLFNDSYEGYPWIYNSNATSYNVIFLEDGHRQKYGLL